MLPREAVDAPFLAVCKAKLNEALNNLWKVSLSMMGGLEQDFKNPSNPNYSMIL